MSSLLLALAFAGSPEVELPPEHPQGAMRTETEAEACAEALLDATVGQTCADGRCRGIASRSSILSILPGA